LRRITVLVFANLHRHVGGFVGHFAENASLLGDLLQFSGLAVVGVDAVELNLLVRGAGLLVSIGAPLNGSLGEADFSVLSVSAFLDDGHFLGVIFLAG